MAEPTFALVDSHTHIDMPEFDGDREEVVARARAAGVVEMLVVGGVDESGGHRRALEVAASFGLPATAGVHPHEARIADERVYGELRGLVREGRIVAIGEIGLDFHYDHSPRAAQREAFRRQVRLAREVGLPIVVHTREADGETAEILEQEGRVRDGRGHPLLHGRPRAGSAGHSASASSSPSRGSWPSRKADVIRQVAGEVPEDRLLIETDAPYLAPPPHRGKRNEPAFVVEVARKVAALRGTSMEAVADLARRNYARLFRRTI